MVREMDSTLALSKDRQQSYFGPRTFRGSAVVVDLFLNYTAMSWEFKSTNAIL